LADSRPALTSAELDAWVLATAADAVAYATSLLRDPVAAEDVVQDCFCRLLARADVYDLPRDGRKLMFRSITNACINLKSRDRGHLGLGGEDDRPGLALHDPDAHPPERVLMVKELAQAVAEGLALLPLAQRAALELRSLGHSLEEIADALSVSAGNAGVLVHRARQAMARHLAPYLEECAG
jgi:RNA polymerase sigma factor (sigma-70 family)